MSATSGPPPAIQIVPGLPLTNPDLVCVLDLDANGNETKSDLETLEQDVLHVLLETIGSNPDDPDRGVGIDQLLSGTLDDLQKLPRTIENQLESDDRIDGCSAALSVLPGTSASPSAALSNSYLLAIQIQVDGSVITLQYGYVQGTGLVPLAPVQGGP